MPSTGEGLPINCTGGSVIDANSNGWAGTWGYLEQQKGVIASQPIATGTYTVVTSAHESPPASRHAHAARLGLTMVPNGRPSWRSSTPSPPRPRVSPSPTLNPCSPSVAVGYYHRHGLRDRSHRGTTLTPPPAPSRRPPPPTGAARRPAPPYHGQGHALHPRQGPPPAPGQP